MNDNQNKRFTHLDSIIKTAFEKNVTFFLYRIIFFILYQLIIIFTFFFIKFKSKKNLDEIKKEIKELENVEFEFMNNKK